MNGLAHKPHTPLCRERFGKLMMQDPIDCHRVANALQREYAYHEKHMRKTYDNTINDDDKNKNSLDDSDITQKDVPLAEPSTEIHDAEPTQET